METKYSPTQCAYCVHAYTTNLGTGYYGRNCKLTKSEANYMLESDGVCPNYKGVNNG